MIRYFNIYKIIFKNAFTRDINISGVIIFNLVISLLEILMTVIMFNIIFSNVESLSGWNFYQVLFIFSMMKITGVLSSLFYRKGLGNMATETIRKGDYDFYLVKPVNPMIMVSMSDPRIYQILTSIAVVILSFYSAIKADMNISAINIIMFLLLFILGQILFYFLTVISIIPTFWYVRLYSLRDAMNRALQFARYPAGIFSRTIKVLLFAIFPILATTYIPAETLFYRPKYYYIIYMLIITILFGFLSIKLWKAGEKHYGSASS